MAKEDNMGNQEEKFIEKDERDVRISKINILNIRNVKWEGLKDFSQILLKVNKFYDPKSKKS